MNEVKGGELSYDENEMEEDEDLTIPKTHKCNVCSKLFAKKCYLDIHLRIHTGEVIYIIFIF